jgi:recombinational DNA repair protein RecR
MFKETEQQRKAHYLKLAHIYANQKDYLSHCHVCGAASPRKTCTDEFCPLRQEPNAMLIGKTQK